MTGIPEGKAREKGVQAILETIMTDNYSKHQTTLPGSLETTRKINAGEKKKKKNTSPRHIIFKLQKTEKFKESQRKKAGKEVLTIIIEIIIAIITDFSLEQHAKKTIVE